MKNTALRAHGMALFLKAYAIHCITEQEVLCRGC